MSQVCCVEDCNHSRSKNKCTLKRFPTDTHKCKLWEDIIKRDGWERTSWDRICECHFSDEQFEQNRADGLRKLRWDAVPSLFGPNLRVLTKAAAEDVADRKDSEEGMEENDELEELEVEIEENSNSDECSDVETYIITGDLSKSIQVIKERESPSTARSNEKQSSDSPPSGKSKTKRIVIRVPSSVGDCTPAMTDDGDEGDQLAEEERFEENIQDEEGTTEQVEESNSTVATGEENITMDDNLDKEVSDKQWNVEKSIEGELENSTEVCDSVGNIEESVNLEDGSTVITSLEENVGEIVEAGGDETAVTGEVASRVEVNTEVSESLVFENQPENAIFAADDVRGTISTDNQVTTCDEHGFLTDTDLSQVKSDWKNPKLQARDVKLMACGGSSKYKKKHQLFQSKASHGHDAKIDGSPPRLTEKDPPVAENLENVDLQQTLGADEEHVAETVLGSEVDCQEPIICDEDLPDHSVPTCEAEEPSEVETNERLELEHEDLPKVPEVFEKDSSAEADDAIVSIEEKLEKIFSNDGDNNEEVRKREAEVEPSCDNLHVLTSNNESPVPSVENNVVTRAEEMADVEQRVEIGTEQTACVEATENDASAERPSSDAVSSADVPSCDGLQSESQEMGTLLTTEGKSVDQTEDAVKNIDIKSEAACKKSPKKRKERGVTPSESNGTEDEDTSKKHGSSLQSQSRRSRGSRDSVEENRRGSSSSSKREHSNHKESSRRSDKEKSSPEKSKQHNSHGSREEKVGVSKRTGKTEVDAKKNLDESKRESEKRRSPTKESRQTKSESEVATGKSNTKTKEQPKELRSSKRCLITMASTRRKLPIKEEVVEDESEEDVEVDKPISKKAKVIEEAVTPAQTKRRGRPPKGRESISEKVSPEESKSLRHSKRTPKPSEKYRDSQSGKSSQVSCVEEEHPRRTLKRKFSSEDEDDVNRKSGRGGRPVKRKSSRCASPVVRKRQEAKNIREEEEEEEEDAGSAQCMCRICGTEQQILLSIFGPEGSQLRLEDKIHSHLPIRVRQNDKLPLGVCHSCVVTLSACDSLVDKCTQVDKKLRKIFNCPPDETIEEDSDHVTESKEKSRPLPAGKASSSSQVAAKRVAGDRPSIPPSEEVAGKEKTSESPVEPIASAATVVPAAPVASAAPTAPELPAEPSAPVSVAPAAPVVHTAPVVQTAPVVPSAPVSEPQIPASAVISEVQQEMEQQDTIPAPQMVMVDQLAEAMQHDAILVKKEEYDSETVSPMKRFGNTYSTGRRMTSRVVDATDTALQDRNSVIVIPPAETTRPSNDVPPHSEEYILSMDEPPDDAPKTVVDSILDDWDEEEQDRATTSAANSRVLTIKNPPDSEIVVTRLFNDEEEILAEGESGEIIIQIQEFSGETREQPFWPAPDPAEETIIPDTDEQQNLTWKCGECGLRGKSVGAFLEHKKGHQVPEKKLFCTLCDQSFTTVEMLALHKKEKHYEDEEDDEDDEDEELGLHMKKPKPLIPLDIEEGGFYPGGSCKLYKCAQCDKMFGAAWSWKKHMEAHELDSSLADNRVHKCDVCNRVFFDKTTFEDHKLTHIDGETPFQCSICDAKFATWNVFLTHVHTHKSSKTICKKCGRDFGDVKILRDHVKEAHPVANDKKFACHLCDKVCRKKIALTEHIRKHTGEMPFECEVCHKRFSRLANYRAHAAIHENQRRFACDVCGKRFNRQSIQQRHMKTHMRDTIKTSHVCRVCGEAFNKVNELLEHRLNHTRDDVERAYWMDVKLRGDAQDFTCKVCDMRFTTVEAVLLHMPSHTDDERDIALKRKPKAYTCDICHRTLWSKRTFQTHKQWHEQKQFPCSQCDKKYATQTGLNYHMFLHTGERPFQCSFCDKCYKNKNDLRIHVRLHTGEYPYKCKFCPKAFRSPSSLIKHGDAHTEERPFKCSYCDQAFKRENTRANHERIHTNDKRFTCKYCNKGFIQKGACMKHEKWHENENKKNSTSVDMEGNTEENMEENDSRDTLEIPEPSESGDSMDSFLINQMEERDIKAVDVGGMSMPSQTSQGIVAEPVDEANVTAPSSADNNIHITLL